MPSTTVMTAIILILSIILHKYIIHPLFLSPLSAIPGPTLYALTKWRLALDDARGNRSEVIYALHQKYGPAVRIGPAEISFNSLSSMRTIYGAGSFSERTPFYDMFDVYNTKNLFTFHSSKQHSDRKRLLAHAYSKTSILRQRNTFIIRKKVGNYLKYLERECDQHGRDEIFVSLHYFAIDAITEFLYGKVGATDCLDRESERCEGDRRLLMDIMSTQRRRLSWFAVHFPGYTRWLYSRTGVMRTLAKMTYPMTPPTTYTGIRDHALYAWKSFQVQAKVEHGFDNDADESIVRLLYDHQQRETRKPSLSDLDVASECADHLLAGIDTTSDSLMFLIWAISRPENAHVQQRLITELDSLSATDFDGSDDVPKPEVVTDINRFPYLDLVIKETLRLYAPLPASEPRRFPAEVVVDGYKIPAETVIGMSPHALHRNGNVFPSPLKFVPERWEKGSVPEGVDAIEWEKREEGRLIEMRKWFWAFSSGPRMCIGIHLAMAEMTTFIAAVYRKYTTELSEEMSQPGVGPGITSRFEIFHDMTLTKVSDHECFIRFIPRK